MFSCTDCFLFSIINININIKGCGCLSKPQTSALHLQLSPLPVLVKTTENNPSAILFLTDPVFCLHLLWQYFLQKASWLSEAIKVSQDMSLSEFESVLRPVGQSYRTQKIPKWWNSGSTGPKWLMLEAFLCLEATNWVKVYQNFTRWLKNTSEVVSLTDHAVASVTLVWFSRPLGNSDEFCCHNQSICSVMLLLSSWNKSQTLLPLQLTETTVVTQR